MPCDTDTFLDNVRTELLDGQGADIALELTDDSGAETTVVEVQDVLDNLIAG